MKLNFYNKPFQIFFHAFFAFMAFLAVYYFKERLFVDTAYFAFHLLNDESFRVEHQRFIVLVSEIMPLIAIYLGSSIQTVLIIYSLGHILYFYLLFLICYYQFRDPMSGWAMVLICVIGVRTIFFSPMYEIWYGLGLMVLWDCLLRSNYYKQPGHWIIFVSIETTVLFSYPLFFIPVTFLLIKKMLQGNKGNSIQYASFFLLILLWAFLKWIWLDNYEEEKFSLVNKVSETSSFAGIFNPAYLSGFVSFFLKYYAELSGMWIITTMIFFVEKKKWETLLTVTFFFGYILIVNLTLHGYSGSIYYERMYMSLIPIVVLTFLSDTFIHLSQTIKYLVIAGLLFIIAFRSERIIDKGNQLSARVAQTERLINYCHQFAGDKFVINEGNLKKSYTLLEWSFPMETMIFSALKGKDSTLTICSTEDMNYQNNQDQLKPSLYLQRRWDLLPVSSLNPKYFHLGEDEYAYLNDSCDNSRFFNDSLSHNILISIQPEKCYQHGSLAYIRIQIENKNPEALCSLPLWTSYFTYHFIKENKFINAEELNTPPEADIRNSFKQDIQVHIPDEPGNYALVVLIVYRGKLLSISPNAEIRVD